MSRQHDESSTAISAERPWPTPVRRTIGETYIEKMINRDVASGHLQVSCWCGATIRLVPIEHVRRGVTVSCSRLRCIYWFDPEGLRKHVIKLQVQQRKRERKKNKSP